MCIKEQAVGMLVPEKLVPDRSVLGNPQQDAGAALKGLQRSHYCFSMSVLFIESLENRLRGSISVLRS